MRYSGDQELHLVLSPDRAEMMFSSWMPQRTAVAIWLHFKAFIQFISESLTMKEMHQQHTLVIALDTTLTLVLEPFYFCLS